MKRESREEHTLEIIARDAVMIIAVENLKRGTKIHLVGRILRAQSCSHKLQEVHPAFVLLVEPTDNPQVSPDQERRRGLTRGILRLVDLFHVERESLERRCSLEFLERQNPVLPTRMQLHQ
jgi:hypothetical protein